MRVTTEKQRQSGIDRLRGIYADSLGDVEYEIYKAQAEFGHSDPDNDAIRRLWYDKKKPITDLKSLQDIGKPLYIQMVFFLAYAGENVGMYGHNDRRHAVHICFVMQCGPSHPGTVMVWL